MLSNPLLGIARTLATIKKMNKKERIKQIKDDVKSQFSSITKSIKKGEIDRLSLGTSGIYLNSIFELLFSLEILLDKGLIESAGAVGTSLWERSITLQYFLTDPIELTQMYTSHRKVKQTPWNIKQMVNGIIDSEKLSSHRNPEIEKDLLYIQYTYLCAIKHGNPFTLSYLNRLEKNGKESNVIGLNPNFTEQDEDIKNWILLVSITTAFEGLLKFAQQFGNQDKINELLKMNRDLKKTIIYDIDLKVPQIILASAEEFREEFWNYLEDLKKQ